MYIHRANYVIRHINITYLPSLHQQSSLTAGLRYLKGSSFYSLYLISSTVKTLPSLLLILTFLSVHDQGIPSSLSDSRTEAARIIIIIIINNNPWQVLQIVVQTQTIGFLYVLIHKNVIFYRKQSHFRVALHLFCTLCV